MFMNVFGKGRINLILIFIIDINDSLILRLINSSFFILVFKLFSNFFRLLRNFENWL
jgi:hypothetical protein